MTGGLAGYATVAGARRAYAVETFAADRFVPRDATWMFDGAGSIGSVTEVYIDAMYGAPVASARCATLVHDRAGSMAQIVTRDRR